MYALLTPLLIFLLLFPNVVGYAQETPPPALPITAPTDLTVTAGPRLMWTDNSLNEDRFIIERGTALAGSSSPDSWQEINLFAWRNVHEVVDAIQQSGRYCYRVRAANYAGDSPRSNVACIDHNFIPPATPAVNITSTTGAAGIDLTWSDNSGNESGFSIERKNENGEYRAVGWVPANDTVFHDALKQSGTYCYRVKGYNNSGSSGYSNEACQIFSLPTPEVPSIAVTEHGKINAIVPINADGVSLYRRLTRKVYPDAGYDFLADIRQSGTFYDRTAIAVPYCYRAQSYNATGSSLMSAEICK